MFATMSFAYQKAARISRSQSREKVVVTLEWELGMENDKELTWVFLATS